MKPTHPRTDLLLLLSQRSHYGINELVGNVCYRYDPDLAGHGGGHDRGDVLTPHFLSPHGRYDCYADLRVRAGLDPTINDGCAYGWAYEYHQPLAIDSVRAQSMATFLRRTDRQIAAMQQQFGAPSDYAAFLTRFATALGITRYATRSSKLRPDGTYWIWMEADQMRSWIQRHERSDINERP